jgi:hypothetical protein
MNETKILLEQILTAQILSLSMQMDAVNQAKGSNRIGGDYTRDAVRLIHNKQPHILEFLRQNQSL